MSLIPIELQVLEKWFKWIPLKLLRAFLRQNFSRVLTSWKLGGEWEGVSSIYRGFREVGSPWRKVVDSNWLKFKGSYFDLFFLDNYLYLFILIKIITMRNECRILLQWGLGKYWQMTTLWWSTYDRVAKFHKDDTQK